MTSEQILAEIREANLSYLMLAQSLIRSDRDQALFRLGISEETADMIADILLNGADPASTPVRTFDNGTATINTETCAGLGLDFDALSQAFAPYCTKIATLTTAESFS